MEVEKHGCSAECSVFSVRPKKLDTCLFLLALSSPLPNNFYSIYLIRSLLFDRHSPRCIRIWRISRICHIWGNTLNWLTTLQRNETKQNVKKSAMINKYHFLESFESVTWLLCTMWMRMHWSKCEEINNISIHIFVRKMKWYAWLLMIYIRQWQAEGDYVQKFIHFK